MVFSIDSKKYLAKCFTTHILLYGRFLYECVLLPRVFPNLRRMHEYWNLLPLHKNNSLFISLLLSCFVRKKYILHGNMGTYKIGGAPPA
jgi:hypothetical protein